MDEVTVKCRYPWCKKWQFDGCERCEDKRKGDWIETYTGKKFYPLDPYPKDVCIEDIAQGLSNMCRYNGQVKYFFSVAQHSVNCAKYAKRIGLTPRLQMLALLHDAAEAYVSDVAKPLKPYLTGFRDIEHRVQAAVYWGLGVDVPKQHETDTVKHIDLVMLVTEATELMKFDGWGKWVEGVEPDTSTRIYMQSPMSVRAKFIATYEYLKGVTK